MVFHKVLVFASVLLFSTVVHSQNENVDYSDVQIFPDLPLTFDDQDDLCREHSQIFAENLKNLTLWAYESKCLLYLTLLFLFMGISGIIRKKL